MYSYPEALDAMQSIASDLLAAAGAPQCRVSVVPDAQSGTASVTWEKWGPLPSSCIIRMPVLPASYKMGVQEFANYAGLVVHEVGHPLFTEEKDCAEARRLAIFRLFNALEDVRIERLLIEAGIAANTRTVLCDLCHQLDVTILGDKWDSNDPRSIGFVLGYLGRAANGYALDAKLVTKSLRPASKVSQVLKWALPALAACQSSKDVVDLARKVMEALPRKDTTKPRKGNKGKPGQKQEQGQPQDGQKVEPQKGEAQGEAQGEAPAGEAQGEAQQSQAPKQGEKNQGNGGGAGAEQPEDDGGPLQDKDVAEVSLRPENPEELKTRSRLDNRAQQAANVINIIREVRKAAKAAQPMPQVTPQDWDNPHQTEDFRAAQKLVQANRQERVRNAASVSGRLRALLARALKRNEDDLYEGGLKHGKLDRRALANFAAGSQNVMGRREMIDGYDTDVVVLVDGSGSMCSGRIDRAAELALVIAQAAQQVGVNCSTYAFGCDGMHTARSAYGLMKVCEGRSRPDAAIFAELIEVAGGGTPLSQSMLKVADIQVARAKNKRRVMFIVSDGLCSSGAATQQGVANYIEQAMGIELANLSIGQHPAGCFRNEVYVDEKANIAEVGLTQMVKLLERGM